MLPRIVVMLCLIATHPAAVGAIAQWSAQAGEIRDLLAVNGSVAYAATLGGGLFKSADGGASWARVAALPARYVQRLAGNASVLYAATTVGLFKSGDGGATWSQRLFDPVAVVALDPFDVNRVLAGVDGAGLYRSTDGAATFGHTVAGLDSLDFADLTFDPNTNGIAYVATRNNPNNPALNVGGVFKSFDGGASWASWNNGLPNKFVTSLAVDGSGAIVAGVMDPRDGSGAVYRQASGGSWSLAQNLFGVFALRPSANSPAVLWAGTRALGVWRSTDNGASWQQAVDPALDPGVMSGIYALATVPGQPSRVFAAVKGYGLFRSDTAQAASSLQVSPWTFSGAGLKADRVQGFTGTANPSVFFMGLKSGGAWRSDNGGATWTPANAGLNIGYAPDLIRGVTHLSASASDPNLVYAASGGSDLFDAGQPQGLFRWNGSAWAQVGESGVPQSLSAQVGLLVSPFDSSTVFFSLFPGSDPNYGLFRRLGNGTWQVMNTFNGLGLRINGSLAAGATAGRFFLTQYDDLPYLTTDNGVSWSRVNASSSGFSRLEFFALAQKPSAPSIVVAATSNGIYRSGDGGANFTQVAATGLQRLALSGLDYSPAGSVLGADRAGNYYCSSDDGSTWILKATLAATVSQVKRFGGAIYLLTDGAGVYRDDAPSCP
jgi:photosystem II stability/assembly factor-like uncharacterized protein